MHVHRIIVDLRQARLYAVHDIGLLLVHTFTSAAGASAVLYAAVLYAAVLFGLDSAVLLVLSPDIPGRSTKPF